MAASEASWSRLVTISRSATRFFVVVTIRARTTLSLLISPFSKESTDFRSGVSERYRGESAWPDGDVKASEANSLWNVVWINDRIIVFGGHVSASVQSEFEASRGRKAPSRSFPLRPPSPQSLRRPQRDYRQHQKDSITRSIAGCLRFLTLIQCGDRPER
jgi:hypothetical protein